MEVIYAIHNFAKRLVMMLAVGLLAVNTWGTVTVPSGWTQVTSLSGIAAGDKIIIVTNDGSMYLNGSVSGSGHFSATVLDATHPASASASGVIELVSTGTTDRYKLKLVSTNKYITATGNTSGNAKTDADSDSYGWQFESSSSGEFDTKYQETGKQAYLRSYSDTDFRTYGTKTGKTFQIYKYAPTYNLYLMSGCTGGNYSSNKGTSGSGTGGYSSCTKYSGIAVGTSVTITATPSSGYQFDGWDDDGYSIILDDATPSPNEITPSSTTATTATFTMPSSDVVIWQCNFSLACAYSMSISKGTGTNCTFTLGTSGSQYTCSGVSTTVTVSPTTGYGSPSVTQSGASAAPTITGSGNNWTVSYGNNTTGTSTIAVSCSANEYAVLLEDGDGTGGDGGVDVTYNSNDNITSVTVPTLSHFDFGGYYTGENGTGTQLIDEDGYWLASKTGYTDASKNWIKADDVTLYAKWTEHSLKNYRTKCCDILDAINGTATMAGSETTMTISAWSDVSNASSYTVRLYKWNSGTSSWDLANNNSTTGGSSGAQATRTAIATDSKSVTWSGIEYGATYKVTVQAIGNNTTYCDGEETGINNINSTDLTDNKITWLYSIYIDDGTQSDTGWEHHYIESLTSNAGSVDIELESDVDYYQYKLVLAGLIWYGNTGKMTSSNCTSWTFSTGSSNCKIQTVLEGDYTFGLATGTPSISVTYPTADQTNGYKIYFDKSAITGWGDDIYYRIGKPSHHTNNTKTGGTAWTAVPGTDDFYVTETMAYDGFEAWQIANNTAWCDDKDDSHSIYVVQPAKPSTNAYDITYATTFQKYVVGSSGVTLVPTSKKNTEDGCDFWNVSRSEGMLTHTATITTPSHGTITIAYTDVNSTSQSKTETTEGLAHRTVLTITATPATGYSLTSLTVGGNAHTSGNTYVLDDDATIAATFSAQTSSVTLQATSATTGSDQTVSATYDATMPLVTTADKTPAVVAISRTGYHFNGWWDATSDGKQYYTYSSSTIASAATWDKTGSQTLYAQWIAKSCSITFDKNGGTGGDDGTTTTYDQAMTTVEVPTREGYTFGGYYDSETSNNGSGNKYYKADGTSNADWDKDTESETTLYANWTVNAYKVTLESPGNVTISSTTPSITEGNYANADYNSTVQLSYTGVTSGMYWGGWKVYKDGDPSTTVTVNGSNQFTMPAYDVKVTAIIYSDAIAWCDPDIEITGDVHLTSTKDVYVHSTSGAGNLISVSSSELGSATSIEVGYLDGNDDEVDKAESLFRLYASDASETVDEVDVSASRALSSTNYSLRYTPGAYGVTNNYKLQLKLKKGDKVLKTVTHAIHGRSLPEEFVIAVKKDNQWYALPNNLESTSSQPSIVPKKITVDDDDTPTTAYYAATTTVYKATGRNAATKYMNGIRFTTTGTNYLQTAKAGDTYNMWLSTTNSDSAQVWYLSSTDFGAYTLKMDTKHNGTKKMGIYTGGYMGFHGSPSASDIYFLPITNKYTEIAATAQEWGEHGVIVKPTTPSDLSSVTSATMNIGIAEPTAATAIAVNAAIGTANRVKVDGGALSVGALANEGKQLYVHWKDEGGDEIGVSQVTVPRIVAADRTANKTNDGNKNVWNTEVHVLPGATLTIDGSTFVTGSTNSTVSMNELHVYPGATINVSSGTLAASTLRLRNGWTRAGDKKYDVARVYIADDAALTKTTASMDYDIYEQSDGKHYYPLAVPFATAVNTIDYVDPTLAAASKYRTHYVIKEYDGANRAINGEDSENNWDSVPAASTLVPGKGYIMTAVAVKGEAIIRIPLTFNNGWTADGELETLDESYYKNKVTVTAHTGAAATSNKRHAGWNMLGVPYMSCFASKSNTTHSEGASAFITGKMVLTGNPANPYGGYNDDVVYVTVPTHDFSEYLQYDITDDDTKLLPGWSFFVQFAEGGTLTFANTGQTNSSSLPIYAPQRTMDSTMTRIKTGVILSTADGETSDKFGLIISDRYTQDYEVGADLEKMFGNGYTLATYSLSRGTRLAFNALSTTEAAQVIPVGYRAPEAGQYTFAINPRYATEGLLRVELIDYQTGDLTDLLTSTYTFTTSRTQDDTRFAIHVTYTDPNSEMPTGEAPPIETGETLTRKFILNGQLYIQRGTVIYDATGKEVRL